MIAWEIASLKALSGHRLEPAFAHGLRGVADLSGGEFRGVLAPPAAPALLARAELRNGVPTWPGGPDLARTPFTPTSAAPRAGCCNPKREDSSKKARGSAIISALLQGAAPIPLTSSPPVSPSLRR